MTEAEQKMLLTTMTEELDERVLDAYLSIAGNKILRKAFPYDPSVTYVPDQYHYIQVEIAAYLINKRGAEGETAHSENGISRSYENGDIPSSLLREIVPVASILGRTST